MQFFNQSSGRTELSTCTQTIFYVDDRRISGEMALDVQAMLDLVVDRFQRVGLSTNTVKTVLMMNCLKFCSINIAFGAKAHAQMNQKEFEQQWHAYTECEICSKVVQIRSLKCHCQLVHPSDTASQTILYHVTVWYQIPKNQS
jgi:hypothetical protein